MAIYTRLLTVERRQDALSGDSERIKTIIGRQEQLDGIIARQEQQIIATKESIGNLNNKINSRARTENKREKLVTEEEENGQYEIPLPPPPSVTPYIPQQPPRLMLRRKEA